MAKKNELLIPKDNNIIPTALEEAMPENYLPYAIEVAKDRALPDVRDGLKPVHRRILYGSYMLKALPDKPYYKSARIVGDILGKFHPHGDTSVYESMVILAQDFSTREPLIDGHGNWGSIDGDSAAAMRYTEARLSPIALEMLRDIEKDTVDMTLNYSDSEYEPTVLPSRYPNLLVNGAFGIAVGLATNIPPHNLKEVTKGVLAYIDNNEITTAGLMKHIKGPDLPTGGMLIGKKSLISAYETGEGKVAYRAKTQIEELENGRLGIVINEFPYRKNKAKILQTISEMTGDKKHAKALELISDIRDESDRNGIRAVIEFKKSATTDSVDKVLKYLFKKTDLQCNLSFNMVALANGKPETMGLKTMIIHYVNHQKEIVTRRTQKELEVAEKRYHIVEGFIKCINILDDVIATIRGSKSKKDATTNLMDKYDFSEEQSQAILELMLYRLTGLEIKVFEKEYKELEKTIKKLKKILSDESELLEVIKNELIEVSDKYGNPRRTEIEHDDSVSKIDVEELIIVEDIMITLSKDGFIKRIPTKNYNRSNTEEDEIEYREGDSLQYLIPSNTKDTLLLFTDKGYMYQLKGIDVPETKWKEKGERVDTILKQLDLDDDKIVNVISIDNFYPSKLFRFLTTNGDIKEVLMDKFQTTYTKLQAIRMRDNDTLRSVEMRDMESEKGFLNITTKLGLDFIVEVPNVDIESQNRNSLPTQLFKLSNEDEIIDLKEVAADEYFELNIGVVGNSKFKMYNKINKDDLKSVIKSTEQLCIFTNKGNLYKIPGMLLKSLMTNDIEIKTVIEDFSNNEGIIKIYSINNNQAANETLSLYSFTSNGMVKKTPLADIYGEGFSMPYHKLKNGEEIVKVSIEETDNGQLLLVSKNGMGIKFLSNNVNQMGRVASGVTGISLKEDDEIIFAQYINEVDTYIPDTIKLKIDIDTSDTLLSQENESITIAANDLKIQNRAGKGSRLVNGYIKKIEIK